MNLHWLDITTLVVYFAGVVGIGFYFSKKILQPKITLLGDALFQVGLSD